MDEQELILATRPETTRILWNNLLSSKFSDQLLLISLKIKLKDAESIWNIGFK